MPHTSPHILYFIILAQKLRPDFVCTINQKELVHFQKKLHQEKSAGSNYTFTFYLYFSVQGVY